MAGEVARRRGLGAAVGGSVGIRLRDGCRLQQPECVYRDGAAQPGPRAAAAGAQRRESRAHLTRLSGSVLPYSFLGDRPPHLGDRPPHFHLASPPVPSLKDWWGVHGAAKGRSQARGHMTATNQTSTRWIQLAIGIVCMIMIANLQYGWTLFVEPIHKAHGWSLTNIQWAFSLFVALETWLSPLEGWIVDILGPNRGPKAMVLVGGVLIAIA